MLLRIDLQLVSAPNAKQSARQLNLAHERPSYRFIRKRQRTCFSCFLGEQSRKPSARPITSCQRSGTNTSNDRCHQSPNQRPTTNRERPPLTSQAKFVSRTADSPNKKTIQLGRGVLCLHHASMNLQHVSNIHWTTLQVEVTC